MCVEALLELVLHYDDPLVLGRHRSEGVALGPVGATRAFQTGVLLLLGPASLMSGRDDRTEPEGFQSEF